jgi:hypothetical protein
MPEAVTLCITMGKRPELLQQTLRSLFERVQVDHVLAVNDFLDDDTNDAFRDVCPWGQLVLPPHHVGHHPAVDLLYQHVKTPYVFHCEDDWLFEHSIDLAQCQQLLREEPALSMVCFRSIRDVAEAFTHEPVTQAKAMPYVRLDQHHAQWYGYTFNPHLASLDLWRSLGGFSQFRKERHISRHLRKQGRVVAYAANGPCAHLGADDSVSTPAVTPGRWSEWWRGLFR